MSAKIERDQYIKFYEKGQLLQVARVAIGGKTHIVVETWCSNERMRVRVDEIVGIATAAETVQYLRARQQHLRDEARVLLEDADLLNNTIAKFETSTD